MDGHGAKGPSAGAVRHRCKSQSSARGLRSRGADFSQGRCDLGLKFPEQSGGPHAASQRFHTLPSRPMARLTQVFAGRDREFFDLFEEAAQNVLRGADLLDQMMARYPDSSDLTRDIVICEQEGDRITHDVHQRLNSTFVTPIDREDVLRLISDLDDIIDLIDEVADYLGLYKIEAPMEQAQLLAHVLMQACRQIAEAMPRLRSFDAISRYTVEINRLENDGDRISRDAIASLFESGIDPLVVIRWKDIFERLEDAIDACETTANILEGIVIKNA